MERVKTGVEGFDELVEGGFPKGASILAAGGAGCGKTIFATSYIYYGAKNYNESGIFVTIENNVKNLVWNMENFGWDIKPLEQNDLMKIYKINIDTQKDIEEQIQEELDKLIKFVKEFGAKRLAIDSITALGNFIESKSKLRYIIYKFVDSLKDLNCTTLMTSETDGRANSFSSFGVEEFVSDGIVAMYFVPPHRSIFVRKMRGTKHSPSIHPLSMKEGQGLLINPNDEILWSAIK